MSLKCLVIVDVDSVFGDVDSPQDTSEHVEGVVSGNVVAVNRGDGKLA
ncbi:MAG: hypothetical protein AAF456_13640 [Planctomycetota bacterium]